MHDLFSDDMMRARQFWTAYGGLFAAIMCQ